MPLPALLKGRLELPGVGVPLFIVSGLPPPPSYRVRTPVSFFTFVTPEWGLFAPLRVSGARLWTDLC
jgi:hypothetical protein